MKTESQPPASDIPSASADSTQPRAARHDTAHSKRSSRRLTGKVARLPKEVRDKLNRMLQDGLPYAQIIKKLGRDGKHLTVPNLSRWKDSGYQDWLLEQAFVDRIRHAQESAWDLSRDFDATRVTHAALQLATLHIFSALRDLKSGSLDDKLGGNSDAFVRLVNALAHASRETLAVQPRRSTADAFADTFARLNLSSLLNAEADEEEEDEEGDEQEQAEEGDEEEGDEEEADEAQTPPPEADVPPTSIETCNLKSET